MGGDVKIQQGRRQGASPALVQTSYCRWWDAFGRRPRVAVPSGTLWPLSGRSVAWALVALAVVIGTMVLVDARSVTQARALPYWLIEVFRELTDFGKAGWFLWPVGIALAAIACATPFLRDRFTSAVLGVFALRLSFIFAAIAVPGLFVSIVKRLIGRARPFVTGEADPFAWAYFVWRPDYASMPSGHTTSAFAAAFAIGALWPKARPFMWSYAVLIAVSRVVVTAHYPSDVLAGAVVGTLGALLVRNWFAARGLVFSVGQDGKVRPRSGPSARRMKKVARRLAAQ